LKNYVANLVFVFYNKATTSSSLLFVRDEMSKNILNIPQISARMQTLVIQNYSFAIFLSQNKCV